MSLPKIPSDTDDYQMTAVIGGGLAICGIAPKRRLVTFAVDPCWNCQGRVLRRFSGSGWYEDDYLCLDCGENVGTAYRPFKRAWRKDNIKRAEDWLPDFVEREAFGEHTTRMVREEMEWEPETTEPPGSEQGGHPVTPETPTAGAETGPGAPNGSQTCNYPSVGPEPSGGRTANEEGQ